MKKSQIGKVLLKGAPLMAALASVNANALTIFEFEFIGDFTMYLPGGGTLGAPYGVNGVMNIAVGSSLLGPFNGLASMHGIQPFVGYNWTANGPIVGYQNLSGTYAPAYCGAHDMCADAALNFSWGGQNVPVDASFAMDLNSSAAGIPGWQIWAAIYAGYFNGDAVYFDVESLDADGDGIPGTAITAPLFTGFTPSFTGRALLRDICVSSSLTAPDQCTVAAPAAVPVPAALWLFGSGLIGLMGLGRRNLSA